MPPPHLEWLLPEPVQTPPVLTGFGAAVATLLARRGFHDDAGMRAFLDAGHESLHDVGLMTDAGTALTRVGAAVARGERIAIWGDYDADGMTAVAIWVSALRRLGADPLRFVPSRLAEGYGLSVTGLTRLRQQGVDLVITVDCGISNAAEVDAASALGLDVVITDHHLPPARLPRAVAVVDPRRADCHYPDADLTGAGIAYKLAAALLERGGASVAGLAALAAIGTVADMAPMTGESRAIVRLGLAEMPDAVSPGLRALLVRAVEDPAHPTARDLAFGVAPRLNAVGRLADADDAIALLLETDAERVAALLTALEGTHRSRQALTAAALVRARQLATAAPGTCALALRHDEWLPGLVGLVASRLTDDLARPVAAATLVGDEVRGSIRAPADFHVAAALEACAPLLTRRGGHAAAGGFSLREADWPAFTEALGALPRPFPSGGGGEMVRPGRLAVDLVLPARHLGWALQAELERLAPFGPGHPEPVLAVTGLRLAEARRVGAEGQHLAMRLQRGAEAFDAIAFGAPAERPPPEAGRLLDVVGTLQRDTFNGQARLRLRTLDWAEASDSPLRAREQARPAAGGVAVG